MSALARDFDPTWKTITSPERDRRHTLTSRKPPGRSLRFRDSPASNAHDAARFGPSDCGPFAVGGQGEARRRRCVRTVALRHVNEIT